MRSGAWSDEKERAVIVAVKRAGAVVGAGPAAGGLVAWAERTGRGRAREPCHGRLQVAFYGRVSTEDYQDPVMSRARQRDQTGALVAGHSTARIIRALNDAGIPCPSAADPHRREQRGR